jgi:hypothetical protein
LQRWSSLRQKVSWAVRVGTEVEATGDLPETGFITMGLSTPIM